MAGDNLRKEVMNLDLGVGLLVFLTMFFGANIGAG